MNDAEFEVQKARVQRYLDKWMPAGFGWWRIETVWERGNHESCDTQDTAAQCTEQWEYRDGRITFFLGKIKDLTEEYLEEAVVHELSHLLIGSIRDYSTPTERQLTEFAVTSVARALLWTHQHVKP